MAKLSKQDITRVKAMGYLHNRDTEDEFNCRVITGNGELTSEQLANLAQCVQKYGSGVVSLTSRMTVEMKGVKYEHIDAITEHLAKAGLYTGGTGDRIRPVVACKGATCVFGQVNAAGLAQQIHERFFLGYRPVTLPHKFKIAVGGCPNNCVKPDLNDIGLIGQSMPELDADVCKDCKKCIVVDGCSVRAPYKHDGKVLFDRERCDNCGKCIRTCYFGAVKPQQAGVKLVLGGKWGRVGKPGVHVPGIYAVEKALDLVEKAILLYREHGYKKERFGDMMTRLGEETVMDWVLHDDPLSRKEEILAREIPARS